jgi:hypothetical protein
MQFSNSHRGAVLTIGALCGCAGNSDESRTAEAERAAAASPYVINNLATDATFHLVTRVISTTGSVVEFYEPSPGLLYLSEVGDGDTAALVGADGALSPTELYAAVAPGLPIPEKLLLAQARAQQLHGSTDSGQPSTSTSSVGAAVHAAAPTASSYCDNFQSQFRNQVGGPGYSFNSCNQPNCAIWEFPWAGPGAYDHFTNKNQDIAGLCLSSGSTLFSVHRQGDDNSSGSWQMVAYSWRWFSHMAGTNFWGNFNSYNGQIDVTGGSGSFYFAGLVSQLP